MAAGPERSWTWRKAHPPSKAALRLIFENTTDLSQLCSHLHIPSDIRDVDSIVEYILQSKDQRKVRKSVFYLDVIGDTTLADIITEYAEPPIDQSLNPHLLVPVFRAITADWHQIGGHYITVPQARVRLFNVNYSDQNEITAAAAVYYSLYHYDPSWKELAVWLYRAGETEAVGMAKPHILTVIDPSLTPANILQATQHIPLWGNHVSYKSLDIPESQHNLIASAFEGEEAKRELFTSWLTGHPYPTWDHVKDLLRRVGGKEGERAIKLVEETYIKMTPEKARQILDVALQESSFPLMYLKSMAVGVARSGKTLSKNHVLKIKYDPNCSISTGVCEAPFFSFRPTTLELFLSLNEVNVLKYEGLNEVLANVLRKGSHQGRVGKVVEELVQVSSSSTEAVLQSSLAIGSGDSAASMAVVSAMCADSNTRAEAVAAGEALFNLQMLVWLDSGGQPQFHEVAAAFSHNVSLALVYIKLNEHLDALVTNSFTDEEGEWFTEQCPSLLTNEQTVVQFVHTMMCKPVAGSEGMHTRFMVIGTHRDLMHECDETLAQKNERLANLFLPALEENLVMNGNDIIFPVNAKNPDKNDEKCFDLLREKVADWSGALDVDTPIAFLVLLNDVNKYAEEQRKKVVSMEECQTIAGRLKMNRQSLEAALVFFNQLSVWMYVPLVLPDVVFVDPQMPQDSINRIVQYSFRAGGGAIPGLAANECRLWKEGVVSSEMLKGEEFHACFVKGLFDADDALKLFEKLYIVAPLNEREFIMPAMLQTVAEKDMERYVPAPSEHVAPLFLHFHMSRIANGVFCSTHTCMRSKYGWTTSYTMVKRKLVPVCLFRNAIQLQHPKKLYKVIFIHAVTHFVVYLTAPQADLPSVCPEIRDMLLNAVDCAMTAFRFKDSRAAVAFQCPCSPDDAHTATPNEAHSNLICSLTGEVCEGPLTPAQRVWLGPLDFKLNKKEAELIVKEMLQKEGEFKQKNMVVVITGLMEAGKTTLLHKLFGKELPPDYVSTPVAQRPWRGITQYTADRTTFKFLDNVQDVFKLVANVKIIYPIKNTEERKKEDTATENIQSLTLITEDQSTEEPAYKDGSLIAITETGPGTNLTETTKAENESTITLAVNESSSTAVKPKSFDEMVDIVRHKPNEVSGELELVHMVDTGGQPECLEVLPSLIHNADLIMLLVSLSKGLDDRVTPNLHRDGKSLGKKPLLTCNKQLIEQLAQTMAGQRNSKILVVATHKDVVALKEKLFEKRLKCLNSFLEVLPKKSLLSKLRGQIAFDIDLLNPDDTLEDIHTNIASIKIEPLRIPSSFVLFERDIQLYLEDKDRKVEVVTFTECLDIGKKLNMTETVVKAALTYFHDSNIILYFGETEKVTPVNTGSQLIFFDPKFLISLVDTIVHFSYIVADGKESISPALTEYEMDSLSEGVITEDLLRHEWMAKNFIPGLYEASRAIDILKQLYIITERGDPAEAQSNKEYIMMCLLPHLSPEEFQARRESLIEMSTKVEPLFIEFAEKGSLDKLDTKLICSPSGSFGNTVACLISKYNWKVCTDFNDKQPECLYHEIAMLHPFAVGLEVTLVNKIKCFEVYVDFKDEQDCKHLQKIQNDIVGAVTLVLGTIKIDLEVMEGLKCPCKKKTVCHTQHFKKDSETYKETTFCKYDGYRECKTLWITSGVPGNDAAPSPPLHLIDASQLHGPSLQSDSPRLGDKTLSEKDTASQVSNEQEREVQPPKSLGRKRSSSSVTGQTTESTHSSKQRRLEAHSTTLRQTERATASDTDPSTHHKCARTESLDEQHGPSFQSDSPRTPRLGDVISPESLADIAEQITNWEPLRPRLGLGRAQEVEIKKKYKDDYYMQKQECLEVWSEMKGKGATYQAFITAAEKARNQKLAEFVKSLLEA